MFERTENAKILWFAMAVLPVAAIVLWLLSPRCEQTIVDDQGGHRIKILFVGNGFTSGASLPAQFVDLVRAGDPGVKLLVRYIAYPDYTLVDHWKRETALDDINKTKWDYVVLQDHSAQPVRNPTQLRRVVLLLDNEIRTSNPRAKSILFMTYYPHGSAARQKEVARLFEKIGKDTGIRVAPVGAAVQQCKERYPQIQLLTFNEQGWKPPGAYLAAATIYATIFAKQPVQGKTRSCSHDTIDDAAARLLDETATRVVESYGIKLEAPAQKLEEENEKGKANIEAGPEQSTGPASEQSTGPSSEQSTGPSSEQSTDQSTDQPTEQSTVQSTDQSTVQSSDQSTETSAVAGGAAADTAQPGRHPAQ